MFSSMVNHEKNLIYSERFSYDNYDFYNIYENLEEVYKDDLSKFIYHCNRRTRPTIAAYGNNKLFNRHSYERFISYSKHGRITMEDYINMFLDVFIQNNYSPNLVVSPTDSFAQQLNIVYFSSLRNRQQKHYPFEIKNCFDLKRELRLLLELTQKKIEIFVSEYEASEEVFKPQCNFALETYASKIIQLMYCGKQDQDNTPYFNLLYEFVDEVHRLLWQMVNAEVWNILILAQPKIPYLSFIVHPLVFPITTFANIKEEQFKYDDRLFSSVIEQAPRIVFLNLDGKESHHNIQSIHELGSKIFYISVYKEFSWLQKKQVELEKCFGQEDEKATFQFLCNLYSENILKQFCHSYNQNSKMLLLPLTSYYIEREFRKKKKGKFPQLQKSEDIHFLFQQVIFHQIQQFKPTMIFVSYNGELNIEEDHFTDIVRNLTILAHHKVVLFPNFTNLFEFDNSFQNILDEDDEEAKERVMTMNCFLQQYWKYRPQHVNQERTFSNLCSFVKVSSGVSSLEERQFGSLSSKYNMSYKLRYLEELSEIDEFSFMKNYRLNKWKSEDLETLYKNYGNRQLKENKKENENYEKLIDAAIDEFLLKQISQEELGKQIDKRVYYKRRKIMCQLEANNEQIMDSETQQFENLLKERKEMLLIQNMDTYKTKRVFHLNEGLKSIGHVQCFKISLQNEDNEQVYFEKYTQIIINDHLECAFLINYRTNDNRHIMCSMRLTSIQHSTKARQVQLTQSQQSQELTEEFKHQQLREGPQKQDIVDINYSHCFYKKVLYLFWPQRWNIKDQVRCKLLGLDYKPVNIQKVIRIFSQPVQGMTQPYYKYENLFFRPRPEDIQIFPCIGCSGYPIDDKRFIIFGGINDNQRDLLNMNINVRCIEIEEQQKSTYYRITTKPKNSSHYGILPCLRSKVNYLPQQNTDKNQDKMDMIIKVVGGYGRQSTNFFNLFSYDFYEIDSEHCVPKKPAESKIQRRITKLNSPMQITKNGKFNMIINSQNVSELSSEKFSDSLKDKFIFENKTEMEKGLDKEVIVFIQENFRFNNFKQDQKKSYLFGFNRTIREKIYSQFWSPELYIIDGLKEQIINISLKVQKTANYTLSNFLMPREEDIVSLLIDEDIIYILSSSPVIDSLDCSGNKFALYSGSMSNMNQIFQKRQIQMSVKFPFKKKHEHYLGGKSLMLMNEKIILVGGTSIQKEKDMGNKNIFCREDYFLQKYKNNKLKIKVKKLQLQDQNLELTYPVVVKNNDQCFLYSLVCDYNFDEMSQQSQMWKIKIQTFSQNSQVQTLKIGQFHTYFFNRKSGQLEIYPQTYLKQPKFVRISPYKRFNIGVIRQIFSKILWRINKDASSDKMEDEKSSNFIKTIKEFHKEANDEVLQNKLSQPKSYRIFEQIIEGIWKRQKEEKKQNRYFEEEQLLKDLKNCYSHLAKMRLQKKLFYKETNEPEYRFFIEDKSSKKVKYIAIGPLNTTKLHFFRIRFKNELLLCINQQSDEGFFYHPLVSGFAEIQQEVLKGIPFEQVSEKEEVKTIPISYK